MLRLTTLGGFRWSESDEARARYGLNQLLYVQRQAFDEARHFLGKKALMG